MTKKLARLKPRGKPTFIFSYPKQLSDSSCIDMNVKSKCVKCRSFTFLFRERKQNTFSMSLTCMHLCAWQVELHTESEEQTGTWIWLHKAKLTAHWTMKIPDTGRMIYLRMMMLVMMDSWSLQPSIKVLIHS